MYLDNIVGYTYRADIWCPACLAIEAGRESTIQREHHETVEQYLDRLARYFTPPLDREDERSFDSGNFPKVVFADQTEDERCCNCGEPLR